MNEERKRRRHELVQLVSAAPGWRIVDPAEAALEAVDPGDPESILAVGTGPLAELLDETPVAAFALVECWEEETDDDDERLSEYQEMRPPLTPHKREVWPVVVASREEPGLWPLDPRWLVAILGPDERLSEQLRVSTLTVLSFCLGEEPPHDWYERLEMTAAALRLEVDRAGATTRADVLDRFVDEALDRCRARGEVVGELVTVELLTRPEAERLVALIPADDQELVPLRQQLMANLENGEVLP